MGKARALGRGLGVLVLGTGLLAGCASLPAGSTVATTPATAYPPAAAGQPPAQPITVGMDAGQVDARLGSPAMVMAEGSAEWWRYAAGDCAMDVFLLRDPRTSRTQVTWVDTRSLTGTTPCTLDHAPDPHRSAEAALPVVHLY